MTTIQVAPNLSIPTPILFAQRIALVGKSGSGKTNTLQIFAQESLKRGIPFTFINPISKLYSMPGAVIVRWRDPDAITLTESSAPALAEMAIRERLTVLLDMRMCPAAERMPIVTAYMSTLWDCLLEQDDPQPYGVYIDEAQVYAPQDANTPLKAVLIDMAMRSRHMNVISIIATQRPSKIDKDILNQASLLMAHRLSAKTDTNILIDQLPDLPPRQINAMMRKLATGEALIMGDAVFLGEEDYRTVQVRFAGEGSDESAANPSALIPARPLDADLIDRLRTTLAAATKPAPTPAASRTPAVVQASMEGVSVDEFARLQKQVTDLQEKIVGLYRQMSQLTVTTSAQPRSATTRGGTQLELVAAEEQHDEVQVERTTERITYTSSRSLKHRVSVQTDAFDRLIGQLRGCSRFYRQMLVMLAENPGQQFHICQLAPRFDRAERTVYDAVLYLERLGLLKRQAVKIYTSGVESYLAQHFPDLTPAELFERMLNQLAA